MEIAQNKTVKKYDKYKDSGIEWMGEIQRNGSLEAIFND